MNSSVSTKSSAQDVATVDAPPTTERNELVEHPRLAIARYDQWRTFSTEYKKTAKGDQAKKVHRKKPVLVVRRIMDRRGHLARTVVDIMSPDLQEILKNLYGTRVNVSAVRPEVPHSVLFHSREHFQERLNDVRNSDSSNEYLIFELQAMVDLIEEDWGSTAINVNRLISEGRITFDLLWTLFPPGCLVYRRHPKLNQHQVMRLRESSYITIKEVQHFSITCTIITKNGNHFGFATIEDKIKEFDGTLEQQLFETCGIALEAPEYREGEETEPQPRLFTANGRVMINPQTFHIFRPDSSLNLFVYRPVEDRDNMSDDERSICSPMVLGFCFRSKKWGGFALENLHNVKWSDSAFDSLVLDDGKKTVVHALIRQHSNRRDAFDDLIVGKGKGLVGLLCGSPGTGKTLTAEAVAEIARMPLYGVSAGDLGTIASQVDVTLLRIFELASAWNAVVLLDEADVFLHKRTPLAIERNALVAVFLRHLEYYQGVLIMTTNMNENFDPAFENLGHDSRKILWRAFVRRALQSSDQTDFDENQYNRFADYNLNGRQACTTSPF
ncbi:hypothetical protein H0H92_009339 [Tricholoma furcatifolium]|nr:hypothetical protein H0H92_009339 [Tricholoma furcatifolium]